MKKFLIISAIISLFAFNSQSQCCDGASKHGAALSDGKECSNPQEKSDVKAYYFHNERRCATCKAVEAVTRETITENYGDKIPFESINIETIKNKDIVKKYKITGQTLVFIKGDKILDLTNEAFMYARTNPDKLKTKIKRAIDSLQ